MRGCSTRLSQPTKTYPTVRITVVQADMSQKQATYSAMRVLIFLYFCITNSFAQVVTYNHSGIYMEKIKIISCNFGFQCAQALQILQLMSLT